MAIKENKMKPNTTLISKSTSVIFFANIIPANKIEFLIH